MGAEQLGIKQSGIGAGASRRWLSREGFGARWGCRNILPIRLPSPCPLPKGEGTGEGVTCRFACPHPALSLRAQVCSQVAMLSTKRDKARFAGLL